MQVILLERIDKLGQMGEEVSVKPGFFRNYLLRKKKAIRATKDNRNYFESQKTQLEAHNLKRKEEAQYVAEKVQGAHIAIVRQASEMGQLYGSVRTNDIAAGLVDLGFKVTKSQIELIVPIKTIGEHTANVVLHPEVIVAVNVVVAKSEEEAAIKIKESKGQKAKAQDSEASDAEQA